MRAWIKRGRTFDLVFAFSLGVELPLLFFLDRCVVEGCHVELPAFGINFMQIIAKMRFRSTYSEKEFTVCVGILSFSSKSAKALSISSTRALDVSMTSSADVATIIRFHRAQGSYTSWNSCKRMRSDASSTREGLKKYIG